MAQYNPSKANRRFNDEQPAQPGRAEAVMMRRLMLERGYPLNCQGYMPPPLTTAEAAADLAKLIESEKIRNGSKTNKNETTDLAYLDKIEKPKAIKQSGRVSTYEFITEDELKEIESKKAAKRNKDAARKRLARQKKNEARPAVKPAPAVKAARVLSDASRQRKNEQLRLSRQAKRLAKETGK